MKSFFVPELLSPAGNLEKLKLAIKYGANAVYAGGYNFALRAGADNFTKNDLLDGVVFAHNNNVKLYITINSLLYDHELLELIKFIRFLSKIKVDAFIVSDLGALSIIMDESEIPIHLSTQSSCLNVQSALFYKETGVKRLILGREVSLTEAEKIKSITGLEVELFIHGSMCMSYSGNCIISNYTKGRDSNRGGCVHSCRFSYDVELKNQIIRDLHFMSAKDLIGINLLQKFIDKNIDSIKIEGRMKSNLYVATTTKAYSKVLKSASINGRINNEILNYSKDMLFKVPNRGYTEGNLVKKYDNKSSLKNVVSHNKNKKYLFLGTILEVVSDYFILQIKNNLELGDKIEILLFDGFEIKMIIEKMFDITESTINEAKPNMVIKIPLINGLMPGNVVRKEMMIC